MMTQDTSKKAEISKFERIIHKFRYGLIIQVIRNKLANHGIEFSPYYWFQSELSNIEAPKIKGLISQYSVELLDAKDMKIIGENARGYSEKDFLSRLEDGRLCLGLKHQDYIISFLWINLKECTYKPRSFLLNKDEAYETDLYTMESYRGQNFAPYLEYKCYDILNKMGRYKIYSVREYFNTSAIKCAQKSNGKRLELVLFISLFNKLKWSFKIKSYRENSVS